MEYKSIDELQYKEDEVTGETTIVGYAAVFGNSDRFNDIITAGAFKNSLVNDINVAMLFQHDVKEVIGIWDYIQEDEYGLLVKGRLADTPRGKEVSTLLKMGALKSFSIGYIPKNYHYTVDGIRILTEVELYEISVTPVPVNKKASVLSVKKFNEDLASLAQLTTELIKLKNSI